MFNRYLASGDLGFIWDEQIKSFSWYPDVWDGAKGFGVDAIASLWLDYPFRVVVKLLSLLGLPWIAIDKLLWLGMFILASVAMYGFARLIFGRNVNAVLASIIYATNTYILLLFSGGQFGVALAYAFFPFVCTRFIVSIRKMNTHTVINLREILKNSLTFGVLVMLDIRFAYLFAGALLFYGLFVKQYGRVWVYILLSLGLSVFYHLYWLLPILIENTSKTLADTLSSSGMVEFLSFADMPHTIGLLHPNWPENLFGKVYFMKPEYLMLPLLAFMSLLFLDRIKKPGTGGGHQTIFMQFLTALALIGTFLAKGMREPFGFVYGWLYAYIPGFIMFRDPTKFYTYVAIAYSVMIPFAVEGLSVRFSLSHLRKSLLRDATLLHMGFLCLWLLLTRQVFLGEVKGNFNLLFLREDYVRFKNQLLSDSLPSRVLWLPQKDVFVYSSENHPLLSTDDLFTGTSVSALSGAVEHPDFIDLLKSAGIGYVVVSADPEHKIFVNSYAYTPELRSNLTKVLQSVDGLVSLGGYEDIAVYKVPNSTFIQNIPQFAARQNEWARWGLSLSLLFVILSAGYLKFTRRMQYELE